MLRNFIFIILFLMVAATSVLAEGKFFTAEHTADLYDNETRNELRRFCFYQAQEKLYDAVRQYLKQTPYGRKKWFTDEAFDLFVPLLLTIETLEEKWQIKEDRIQLKLTLRTAVNAEGISMRLQAIHSDASLKKKMRNEQLALKKEKKAFAVSRAKLETSDADDRLRLRSERRAISDRIDQLEAVMYAINQNTVKAENTIKVGMTLDEVKSVAGEPRGTATCNYPDYLNYGGVWVALENGIVTAMIPKSKWAGACQRYVKPEKTETPKETEEVVEAPVEEQNKFNIILKSGQVIATPSYYQIDDIVYYKRYGGIVGLAENKIDRIEAIKE